MKILVLALVAIIFICIFSMIFIKSRQKKKWILFSGALFLIVFTTIGFVFYENKMQKKEVINHYFTYFNETFHFRDSQSHYSIEKDNNNSPTMFLAFDKYNKKWSFSNDALIGEVREERGIQVLRNHIYPHYLAFVLSDFLYSKKAGNDFKKIESYLNEHGYKFYWDSQSYRVSEDYGYEFYNESNDYGIRLKGEKQNISMQDEKKFYSGKKMESFDFYEYMDFFDYHISLKGIYYPGDNNTSEINSVYLNNLIQQEMTNKRLTIELTEKKP